MYLLLYLPDLNHIENSFADLKYSFDCTKGFVPSLNSVLEKLVRENKVRRGISDIQVHVQ